MIPIIKIKFNGVDFDLLYARLGSKEIAMDLNLQDDNLLKNVDEATIYSCNGVRVTDKIYDVVPNKE